MDARHGNSPDSDIEGQSNALKAPTAGASTDAAVLQAVPIDARPIMDARLMDDMHPKMDASVAGRAPLREPVVLKISKFLLETSDLHTTTFSSSSSFSLGSAITAAKVIA